MRTRKESACAGGGVGFAHRIWLVLWRVIQLVMQLKTEPLSLTTTPSRSTEKNKRKKRTTHLLRVGHGLDGQSDRPQHDTNNVTCCSECGVRFRRWVGHRGRIEHDDGQGYRPNLRDSTTTSPPYGTVALSNFFSEKKKKDRACGNAYP